MLPLTDYTQFLETATNEQLIQLHIALDDNIAHIEATVIAPRKTLMEKVKERLHERMTAAGETSSNTTAGIAFYKTYTSSSVADQGMFFDFVVNNQQWDLLEKRAAKSSVESYIEQHGAPPPGVNYNSIRKVYINRPRSKKE